MQFKATENAVNAWLRQQVAVGTVLNGHFVTLAEDREDHVLVPEGVDSHFRSLPQMLIAPVEPEEFSRAPLVGVDDVTIRDQVRSLNNSP